MFNDKVRDEVNKLYDLIRILKDENIPFKSKADNYIHQINYLLDELNNMGVYRTVACEKIRRYAYSLVFDSLETRE